jgi:hypothetical protein
MPKRTNPFQSVVVALQRALHPEATVTESKFLRDSVSGELREVDVVVETRIGPYGLTLSFECRSGTRPADVGWVDEMHGKHQTLPTDKLFLVSQHGFTSRAAAKAERQNHAALSLSAVEAHDWAAELAQHRRLYLLDLRASVLGFIGEPFEGDSLTLDARLRRVACDLDVSVGDIADTLLAHPRVALAAVEIAAAAEGRGAIVQFDPAAGLVATASDGRQTPIDRLSFAVVFVTSRREIRLTPGVIGDHVVSFGGIPTADGHVHLVIVQAPGGQRKVAIYEYGHQQTPRYRDLSDGGDTDLRPLPDSTMRLVVGGCADLV